MFPALWWTFRCTCTTSRGTQTCGLSVIWWDCTVTLPAHSVEVYASEMHGDCRVWIPSNHHFHFGSRNICHRKLKKRHCKCGKCGKLCAVVFARTNVTFTFNWNTQVRSICWSLISPRVERPWNNSWVATYCGRQTLVPQKENLWPDTVRLRVLYTHAELASDLLCDHRTFETMCFDSAWNRKQAYVKNSKLSFGKSELTSSV